MQVYIKDQRSIRYLWRRCPRYRDAGSFSTQAKLPKKEQVVSKQVIRVGLKMQRANKLNNRHS